MITSKNKYIKQIDGLRGISILSVALYHFFPNIFIGGFIGVDIFFVISGFVISKILMEEYNEKKSISFKIFYANRIKRIFPAFFLVIFVSSIFSYFILLPTYLIDFSKSALTSVFFSSNFHFFFTNQSYAAISSNSKPLLHLWSLSVEEQFYIFFPIFIFLFLRFIKKNTNLIIFTFVILLYSFSLIIENYYNGLAFYMLPTRATQFLVGCLVANIYINFDYKKIWESKKTISLSNISLLILIIFIFFISNENLYPSLYILLPIISVAVIIISSKNTKIKNVLLENNILVWFGKISYSLYLWHYPIFVYANYLDLLNSFTNKIIFLILSIVLSFVSYKFYEKKFRYIYSFYKTILISLFFFISIFSYSYLSLKTNGFKDRVPEILSQDYSSIIYKLRDDDGDVCYNRKKKFCHINKNKNNIKIAVIGDSHTALITAKLNEVTEYEIIPMNNTGCYYLPNFFLLNFETNIEYERCNSEIQNERVKKLNSLKDYIILIGGRLPLYLSGEKFDNQEGGKEGNRFRNLKQKRPNEDYYKNIIDPILKLADKNKVLLIYPIPELGWDIKKKILENTSKNILKIKSDFNDNFPIITTSYKVFKERNKQAIDILDSIKGKNIFRVYPHKLFCNNQINERCVANNKKNLFYIDTDHLSDYGSEIVVKMIIQEIKKINPNTIKID